MASSVVDAFKTDTGRILFSIILGLGCAALFRRVCNKPDCVIIKGPKPDSVQQNFYKMEDECFKYEPYVVECPTGHGEKDVVESA